MLRLEYGFYAQNRNWQPQYPLYRNPLSSCCSRALPGHPCIGKQVLYYAGLTCGPDKLTSPIGITQDITLVCTAFQLGTDIETPDTRFSSFVSRARSSPCRPCSVLSFNVQKRGRGGGKEKSGVTTAWSSGFFGEDLGQYITFCRLFRPFHTGTSILNLDELEPLCRPRIETTAYTLKMEGSGQFLCACSTRAAWLCTALPRLPVHLLRCRCTAQPQYLHALAPY